MGRRPGIGVGRVGPAGVAWVCQQGASRTGVGCRDLESLRLGGSLALPRGGREVGGPALLPAGCESCECACAGSEGVGRNAKTLNHVDEQIAEWRWVFGIEGKVLAVLKMAAGQQDWQVFGGVAAAITQVTAEENGGVVEQSAISFLGLFQFPQQVAHSFHRFFFNDFQLGQFTGIATMV